MPLAEAVECVLAKRRVTEKMRRHVAWHLALVSRDDWAAGAERLSLLWFDDGYEVYGYGDRVFTDGAGALIERLGDGLDVRLNQVVRRIDHRQSPVRISTDDATFEADAVVVTLPLGVLKTDAVAFDPPLPESKQQAIARLGMGSLTKVVLSFDAAFWPTSQYAFGHLSPDILRTPTLIVNLWKTHKRPILVMLIGGEQGRRVERWPAEETSAWAVEVLEDVFGPDLPAAHKLEVTKWDSDPFALGSYAYVAVGSTPDDIDALAAPVSDRLLFAGEATERTHWACLHGAYVSGLREAARLTGDPTLLPSRHFTENRRWREMLQRADRFFNLIGKAIDPEEVRARVGVLARSSVFGGVSAGDLKVLATMFVRRSLADGEMLCGEGDAADCVFAIAEGEVDVYLATSTEPVARRFPGDVVGEYGMFLSGERSATLRARGPSSVLTLEYEHFRRFLLAFPQSMLSLFALCVSQLYTSQTAGRRLTNLSLQTPDRIHDRIIERHDGHDVPFNHPNSVLQPEESS